jgi:hypothetical protein
MVGMQARTAALIGLLGLGVGWALGGGLQSSPGTEARQGRASAGPRPLGVPPTAGPSPLTEQLRLKMDKQPRAPRPARNPFVFGSRRAPAASPSPRAREDRTPQVSVSDTVVEPPGAGAEFRLTGMATAQGADGPERTALVHDGRSLLFVKRGDTLPGGFEVVDVQESTVTLRDSTGSERTLLLR